MQTGASTAYQASFSVLSKQSLALCIMPGSALQVLKITPGTGKVELCGPEMPGKFKRLSRGIVETSQGG